MFNSKDMKYMSQRRRQAVNCMYSVKRVHSKSYLIRQDNTVQTDWVSMETLSVWLEEE